MGLVDQLEMFWEMLYSVDACYQHFVKRNYNGSIVGREDVLDMDSHQEHILIAAKQIFDMLVDDDRVEEFYRHVEEVTDKKVM